MFHHRLVSDAADQSALDADADLIRPIRTYSLEEVAAMVLPGSMKSPVRWLTTRLTNGTLAGYKIGRTWRMTQEDVEDLITRHRNNVERIPVKRAQGWVLQNPTLPPESSPASPGPERPPHGISHRSWLLRQRSEIPGTTQYARKYGIRSEATHRPDVMPPPTHYKHVHPESEAVIFNMPPLSDTQQRLLDRVRREREVIVYGAEKKTVESLVRRNLVTYEVAYVLNKDGNRRIYRFTLRAK